MNNTGRHLTIAAIAILILSATTVRADDEGRRGERSAYVVTSLVSDLAGQANFQDTNLKNAWGVAFTPSASPFWISDNATGLSTLYDGAGNKQALVVTIPCPPVAGQGSNCPTNASPTGIVWNPSSAFLVPGTAKAASFDELEDAHDKPIVIDGLWTLTLGGGSKSSPDTLYFTAGPNGETDGLFGTITPTTPASGKRDRDDK
jgi:hypothetical protein